MSQWLRSPSLKLAKQMVDGHAVELWQGACMIAAFEPAAFEPEARRLLRR
jgi:hypothetical protein